MHGVNIEHVHLVSLFLITTCLDPVLERVRLNHFTMSSYGLLLRFIIVNNVHITVIMTIVFMTLSGILQYDMIDYYLFVTYVICVRARISKLG